MVSPLSELFLKYDYAETKDLAKAFLTLNSATLVFSVAFAEKVVGLEAGFRAGKAAMLGAWSAFLVAIAITGMAICVLALAAGRAVYGGDFEGEAMRAYGLLLGGGALYVVGLGALIVAAALSMRLQEAT